MLRNKITINCTCYKVHIDCLEPLNIFHFFIIFFIAGCNLIVWLVVVRISKK